MRGLGAGKARVFFPFFYEQGILCVAGCALGLFVSSLLGTLNLLQAALIAGFILCYLAGSAVSVRAMSRAAVLAVFSDDE
jgi:hypothetical protein